MSTNEVSQLRSYLDEHGPGDIPASSELIGLVEQVWEQLSGASDQETTADKLYRMEKVEWEPPFLYFLIERHGGTVKGSVRAELHSWKIDLETETASCNPLAGHRVVGQMSARLDVRPIADELAMLITSGGRDERLRWNPEGSRVRVLVGKVLPELSAPKPTLAGRRKRLNQALRERLTISGWREVGVWTYEHGPVSG